MTVPEALALAGVQDQEALLIARAQESDRSAWDEIFQRHYQRVYIFVFCRIGEAAAAEDVTADVFVEAWRGIRRFSYRGVPLISWLYKIAHNLIADFFRKSRRSRQESLERSEMQFASPRDEAETVAQWQSLSAAFKKLTLDQQQVLVSRFMEGLTLAETASLLGKKENAIKQLEFRALKSIRKILDPEMLLAGGAA